MIFNMQMTEAESRKLSFYPSPSRKVLASDLFNLIISGRLHPPHTPPPIVMPVALPGPVLTLLRDVMLMKVSRFAILLGQTLP